jgi:Na+/H+-dicarboxylate symporter
MSRVPRFIGYALMLVAALLAVAMKKHGVESVGPLPAVAVLLFLGMIGVMLVFTDLMVRGLYAQVDAAKRERDEEG